MFSLCPYTAPDFTQDKFTNAPDAVFVPAPKDGVAPENFHAMSIYPEYMKVNGQWLLAEESRMDCVAVLENGRIAVDKFAEHEAGYYDAILMDMRMPEMDGLEATRRIRAMDRPDAKSIPIIALTANAFDEDVQSSMQAGLNAHLSKPVEPDILFETLEGLLSHQAEE